MELRSTVSYLRRAGPTGSLRRTADAASGGAAVFGELIRGSVSRHAVQPQEMAAVFLNVLRSRASEWPSAGVTGNLGPYATNTSVHRFFAVQGRSEQGRFTPWVIANDARNRSGIPYANYVDQGIRTGGAQVSADRYRANFRAVRRTWDHNVRNMLRQAEEIARRRRRR